MSIFLQILKSSASDTLHFHAFIYLRSMVWLLALLIAAPLLVFAAHLSAVIARCADLDGRLELLIQKVQAKA